MADISSTTEHPSDLELIDITFGFNHRPLFSSLNFTIKGGQWTCLLGPSGSGKSTLLRIISGSLKEAVSGEINWGQNKILSGNVAWMAQDDLLLPWLKVVENVCLGARLRGESSSEIRQRAMMLLKEAGLEDCINALPAELSGGMRQRVAVLRTLMEERPVILMDEPFSALDSLTRLNLQDLAAKLLSQTTVLLVTHDPLEALRLGHRIHVMTDRPARISQELVPPGLPPRDPGEQEIASLQAELIRRLRQ
jgi:putative hydroxymethylpyrimidine transport system ATP-binding protein